MRSYFAEAGAVSGHGASLQQGRLNHEAVFIEHQASPLWLCLHLSISLKSLLDGAWSFL